MSDSGKSSLVFDTIATDSQRLINETCSAFVQGFMPTLTRPHVDVPEGLTTAIIVDQERMGANTRSTVGTATDVTDVTDVTAMLRVPFSRLKDAPVAGASVEQLKRERRRRSDERPGPGGAAHPSSWS